MQHSEPVSPRQSWAEDYFESNDRDALDIDAILRFIRRSWRLCLIWLALGLFLALGFLIVAPTYYTAYSTVFFYNGARADAAPGSVEDALPAAYVDTQIQLLKSDEVVGRVVDEERLVKDTEFGIGEASSSPAARHATILRVAAALTVGRIGLSDAVSIGFTSKDRLQSAAIANAVVLAYTETRRNIRQRDRAEAASELQRQLADVRAKLLASERSHARSSAGVDAKRRSLQEAGEAYQAKYNNLLRQANTEFASQFSPLGMRVITPAQPPARRSWPRLSIVLTVAVVLSGALGIGHAVLREATDHSLRSVVDAQRLTGVDCVAAVPRIDERPASRADAAILGAPQPAYCTAAHEFGNAIARVVLRLQETQKRPMVIAVVPATEGAGASSVAAHLANALAETGQRTLLLDANWQRPMALSAAPNFGHTQLLASGLYATWMDPAETKNFGLLALRSAEPIAPLNASLSIAAALEQLPAEYDRVIVDFHSAEKTSDLQAGIAAIDGAVIVAAMAETTVESLAALVRALPEDKISAVVVNKLGSDTNDLRTEFAHLARPVARSVATAWTAVPIFLRWLAGSANFLTRRIGRGRGSVAGNEIAPEANEAAGE